MVRRKAKEAKRQNEKIKGKSQKKAKAAVESDDDETVTCNLYSKRDPCEEVPTHFGYSATPVLTWFISIVLGSIETGKDLGDIPYFALYG